MGYGQNGRLETGVDVPELSVEQAYIGKWQYNERALDHLQ